MNVFNILDLLDIVVWPIAVVASAYLVSRRCDRIKERTK